MSKYSRSYYVWRDHLMFHIWVPATLPNKRRPDPSIATPLFAVPTTRQAIAFTLKDSRKDGLQIDRKINYPQA